MPPPAQAGNSGPPIITINGDNPATIQVGSSYADLGATITGPTADLNLGFTTLLDGATTTSIQLDTSSPGQHTIEYRAYDQSGLMGSATRTIIVSASAEGGSASGGNDSAQPQGAEQSSHDGNSAIVPLAATSSVQ